MNDFEVSRFGSVLADLLMGAAYSDNTFNGREGEVVRAKLAEWFEVDELPAEINTQLRDFSPDEFDLTSTAALLSIDDQAEARKVLELVAAVHDADDELDLDEDAFLRALAKELGVDESTYSDLKLEILSVETLREELRTLAVKPPPIPKD